MIRILVAAVAAAVGEPAPETIVSQDALLWVQVPSVGESARRLSHSVFAPLLEMVLTRDAIKALEATRGTRLLAAVSRQATGTGVDLLVLADARAAAEPWQRIGFATPEGSRLAALAAGHGPGGFRCNPERARRPVAPAFASLAESKAFVDLVATSPSADVRARLDVQKLYGLLARHPRGPEIASAMMRLGFDRLATVKMHGRLASRREMTAELRLELPQPWDGLPRALGPPIMPERPAAVPREVLSYARLSVIPSRLLFTVERLLTLAAPLEYTLARTQVDAIERQLGKTIVNDVLGSAPRVWTYYQQRKAGVVDSVLVAELADAAAAQVLAESIVGLLPDLFPRLQVRSERHAGSTVLTVGPVALAFTRTQAVVASSIEAARAHLAHRGKPVQLVGDRVVAHGMQDGASLARLLLDPRRGLLRSLAHNGRESHARLVRALGKTEWSVTEEEGGLRIAMTIAK